MPKTSCLKQNKGFTLVEMVVVLVLMTIFLGVVAMGIIAVQDQAEQISIDNSAENIFVAAQTKITQMNASGQLAEKCESLKGSDGKYIADMIVPIYKADGTSPTGTDYITRSGQSPYNEVYQNMLLTDTDIWVDGKVSDIISLRANEGDYDKYLTNPTGLLSEGTRFLFELISESISDREVLNGAIAIELAPEDAQVFSAFYSRQADKLVYAEEDSSSGGDVDISRRSYSKRHDKLLGYYGVETLTHIDVLPPEELPLGELSVRNLDTLKYHLRFGDEVADVIETKLKYTITVYDSFSARPALILKPLDDEVIANRSDDIKQNLVKCSVTRIDHEQNAISLGILEVPIFWETAFPDETRLGLSFILDAADSSADTKLLDGDGQARIIRQGNMMVCDFVNTLSFFRFGTWTDTGIANWTDNIYVVVDAEDDGSDESNLEVGGSSTKSPVESPYFAYSEYIPKPNEAADREYFKKIDIRNPRHLYNVRYFEDLDIVTLGLYATEYDENTVYHFKYDYCLREDIDWGKFADTTNPEKSSYYASLKSTTYHKSDSAEFPSFRELRSIDTFSGKYDQDFSVIDITDNLQYSHKISGLQISKANNQLHGVYKNYADGQILPTGLFVENKGDIVYLALDQIKVNGENKVGSICGVNSGRLKYCGTMSSRSEDYDGNGVPDPSIITGVDHVGGVFGFSASKGTINLREVVYQNLSNAAEVSGREYIGGITGWLATGFVQIYDNISGENYTHVDMVGFKNCENTGKINGTLRYVGGIVGYIKDSEYTAWKNNWNNYTGKNVIASKIENCYSHPVYDSVYDADMVTNLYTIKTRRHHEVAGDSARVALLQSLNTASYVGGIAGCAIDILIKDSGARYTSSTDDSGKISYSSVDAYGNLLDTNAYIFGDKYVGGIVGFNGAVIENSTSFINVIGNNYVGGIAGIVAVADEAGGAPSAVTNAANMDYRAVAGTSVNRGNVFALYDYVGGVAGLCYDSAEGSLTNNEGCRISGRNYVGSVCGYFQGKRGMGEGVNANNDNPSDRLIYSYCSVDGENFVGGVCGYYRKGGAVPYTNLSFFGPVNAYGSFAGGFFGAVTEGDLLTAGTSGGGLGRKYSSNCTELCGSYFVGGAVGAIIINRTGNNDNSPNYFNIVVDKPDLVIKATAYAGGAIGFVSVGKLDIDPIDDLMKEMAGNDAFSELITPKEKESRNAERGIQTVTDKVNGLNFGARNGRLMFRGFNNSTRPYICNVSKIVPFNGDPDNPDPYNGDLVYASGFVGGDSINTDLKFTYFNSLADCGANYIKTTYIMKEISLYNPETMQLETQNVKMAYSSKLIGINNKDCEITACYVNNGTYSTESTYRGGLVEVNNGKIDLSKGDAAPQNRYQPYHTNDEAADRLGAICGKNNGSILVNSMKHIVVAGRNIVGGIVGENGSSGSVTLQSKHNEEGVVASGYYVGGLIGVNYGSIKTPSIGTKQDDQDYRFMVQGKGYVGGLIGEQVGKLSMTDKYLKPFHDEIFEGNSAPVGVRATDGVAGGLIGRITTKSNIDNITLTRCHYGYKTPVEGKISGGIVGEIVMSSGKNVTLDGCEIEFNLSYNMFIKNEGSDSIVGGMVGHVVKEDGATGKVIIKNCIAQAGVKNDVDGNKSAGIVYDGGGITQIDRCRVYSNEVGYAICAKDAESITNCLDATYGGKSTFGNVKDGGTFKNNYCVERTPDVSDITENTPNNIKNRDIYTVISTVTGTYKDGNTNMKMMDYYAVYNDGADYGFKMMEDVGMTRDPVSFTEFYNGYSTKIKNVDNVGYYNWNSLDDAFKSYLNANGHHY